MARKRRKPQDVEYEGMIMTPMIDIVFQLIVFFIIVLDFSLAVIEPVKLPLAKNLEKTSYADHTLLVVNILKNGTIKINGETFYDAERNPPGSPGERMAFTKLEKLFNTRRMKPEYQEQPGNPNLVRYFMLVRADRSTDFEHVQRLLMMATRYGGVTKVMLAAKEEQT